MWKTVNRERGRVAGRRDDTFIDEMAFEQELKDGQRADLWNLGKEFQAEEIANTKALRPAWHVWV